MGDGQFRIGELAQRHGLSTATLRYYERLGLLDEPERSPSGYRLYDDDHDERLRFIIRAKALDLSLEEIHTLLDVRDSGSCSDTRAELRHVIAHKIREARRRASEAEAFATQLIHVYDRLVHPVAATHGACSCIPDMPTQAGCEIDAELARIDASVCSCGSSCGWLGCACGCGCCGPDHSAFAGGRPTQASTAAGGASAEGVADGCNCRSSGASGCMA